MISGYRLMWAVVMFDLPVADKQDMKNANKFRKFLVKEGFGMVQLSVYAKFIGTRDKLEAQMKRVIQHTPPKGRVDIIPFTDKQYQMIRSYHNRKRVRKENPEQMLILFDEE